MGQYQAVWHTCYWVPEGEKPDNEKEKIFEKMIVEISPNLVNTNL